MVKKTSKKDSKKSSNQNGNGDTGSQDQDHDNGTTVVTTVVTTTTTTTTKRTSSRQAAKVEPVQVVETKKTRGRGKKDDGSNADNKANGNSNSTSVTNVTTTTVTQTSQNPVVNQAITAVAVNASASPAKQDQEKIVKGVSKGGAVVDVHVPKADEYHVVPDTRSAFNGKFLDATLNCSDLGNNNNKFYIIQVIAKDSNPNVCYFWNRWGRVGVPGQNALSSGMTLDQAQAQFLKKFNEKTKSKYTLIDIDYSKKDEDDVNEKKDSNDQVEASKLHSKVQEFINLIYNLNLMKQTMMEVGYDANKMPLGKLGPVTLKQGYEVLKAIETELKGAKRKQTLKDLSSDFYTLIPHNFGFKKMENFIIDNDQILKDKIDLIESLSNIEIATNIIKEAKGNGHIVDQHYEKLHCNIDYIPQNSDKFKFLESYLYNTAADQFCSSNVTLVDAYELKREGEAERFVDYGNKMLLWHGSGINNFVGILSQGMRIAPPEAPSTGYNFGKGVYFADMACKSLCYCRPTNGIGLILLCEVSIGNAKEYMTTCYDAANLPSGCHSTKGCGLFAPHPLSYTYVDDRVAVPNAKGQNTNVKTYLGFNEFIVYDVRQVKLRYVMKFKQNS